VLASAILGSTATLRVALAAVIAPLRHPLLLAKQLATLDLLGEGRLVVQPTVSWSEEEYRALDVPFRRRGAILDEQLEAMRAAWTQTPASHHGRRFAFDNVYLEPKPHRDGGPAMWFGGMTLHDALRNRIVRYGAGFHPFGSPTPDELAALRAALEAAGRDPAELELVGGIRGRFPDERSTASIDEALEQVPPQLAAGYTSICFKPSMYTDDLDAVPELCRHVVAAIAAM
jgi:alkanesulfonate monooxygenase SsuD/methylene tetrahydromethanopterin reductase-like flavin-dependent oxidoreductase (luciferase family)